MKPILIVHGGAGTIATERQAAYHQGLLEALNHGFNKLRKSADALEAVLAAVVVMEDNPDAFNAGTGGSPNREGAVECDAAVMAGHDRSSGAVAAITRIKNPILLADKVRRESPHSLLVAEGAEALSDSYIDNSSLLTPYTRAAWQAWRQKQQLPIGSATVGAVACDSQGRFAAATSTGGVLGKWPGRVGDSPIIGAGNYADANIAVSCTGKGEAFMRAVTAKSLALRLESGQAYPEALAAVLDELLQLDGNGGLISLSQDGQVGIGFNSAMMAYGYQHDDDTQSYVAVRPEAASSTTAQLHCFHVD